MERKWKLLYFLKFRVQGWGQGDLVSRSIGKHGVNIWVLGIINLLTKSP